MTPGTIIAIPGAEEPMVLTLLGDKENYGPNWAVKPGEKPGDRVETKDAWAVFRDYEDPDGFLFYGELWEGQVRWTYWPPETFKIAVYYPERDLLWISEDIYNRYAFRSDYRLVLPAPGENAASGSVDMVLKKEHSVFAELGGLAFDGGYVSSPGQRQGCGRRQHGTGRRDKQLLPLRQTMGQQFIGHLARQQIQVQRKGGSVRVRNSLL